MNIHNDVGNHYFSGQGVVMLATRNSVTGQPQGFRVLGNVPDLKISVATTVIDHKGSQDGQRAIDSRLQTETKATISITIENWIAANLAQALRGGYTSVPGAVVVDEAVTGYPGLISALAHIGISATTVDMAGPAALTEYTDGVAAWDFRKDDDAGSLLLNDPRITGVAPAVMGVTPTGVTVGATTLIDVPSTPAGTKIGDQVYLQGFTGGNAADLNGKVGTLTAFTANTSITVSINSATHTITTSGTPLVTFLDQPIALTVSYTFASQFLTDSLTQPLTDIYLRFEGLNTVETNNPVIVEVFRMQVDPLKELALLGDTYGQFVLVGSVLVDYTRPLGNSSRYFHVRALN